jgi:hypothetical protein
MRKRGRIDSNQPIMVEAFRDMGCSVAITSNLGDGFVDVVLGFMGVNELIEIKDGSLPPSKRRLTPDEEEFHVNWNGSVQIAENLDDVARIVKLMRYKAIKIGVEIEGMR